MIKFYMVQPKIFIWVYFNFTSKFESILTHAPFLGIASAKLLCDFIELDPLSSGDTAVY